MISIVTVNENDVVLVVPIENSEDIETIHFSSKLNLIDYIHKNFENYKDIFENHKETLFGNVLHKTKVIRTRPDAVLPTKASAGDSGFDLTLLDVHKSIGKVNLYSTGIKVQPPYGYYFDMVPRSSIIKSGYMLANSVGIIDQGYTGEIYVPLIKIDPELPDLVLPNKLVQLIMRKVEFSVVEEVSQLDDTDRCEKGFGSSNSNA